MFLFFSFFFGYLTFQDPQYFLQMIYEAENKNEEGKYAFTEEHMRRILHIENSIFAAPEMEKYCYKASGGRALKLDRFPSFPLWFLIQFSSYLFCNLFYRLLHSPTFNDGSLNHLGPWGGVVMKASVSKRLNISILVWSPSGKWEAIAF